MNISFRISCVLTSIAYIFISTCSIVAMEAPYEASPVITLPAKFHVMLPKKGAPVIQEKISFIVKGFGYELAKDAIVRSMNDAKLDCGNFSVDPSFEKGTTLARMHNAFVKSEASEITILCWGKKTKKQRKKEDLKKDIIVQVQLKKDRPILLNFPHVFPANVGLTLRSVLEKSFQEKHIDCSIDDIERIKIGQNKVWRTEHFLGKSLREVKKQAGNNVITIECTPTEK